MNLEFKPGANAPAARFESAVAVANGRMYVIGGHMEPELVATSLNCSFSPVTNQWQRHADAPVEISHVNAVVQDDRFIWLVGGFKGQHPGTGIASSYRYDTIEDRWEDGPPLPSARASGGLALIGANVHYFGGLSDDRSTNCDDHWVLSLNDPAQWERSRPVPNARTHAATTVVNDCIYAIGGHYGHDVPGSPGEIATEMDLDLVHRYDAQEDRWTEVAPLIRRRSHCEPGTFTYNGKIVCIGGKNNHPNARSKYESPFNHFLRRACYKVQSIFAPGSIRTPWNGLNDVIVYDPDQDRWSDYGKIPRACCAPAAAAVDDVMVVTSGANRHWQDPSNQTHMLKLNHDF